MKFVDDLRAKPAVQKLEKFIPAIAFLGGFGWDSITLGSSINDTDLIFLLAYYIGALVMVVLLSAHLDHPEGWTAERIKAAASMQKQATKAAPAKASATVSNAIVSNTSAPNASVSSSSATVPNVSKKEEKSSSGFFSKFSGKLPKSLTEKAAQEAKAVADKASAEAGRLASAVADKAAHEAKAVADKAAAEANRLANEAGKFAKNMGYESTAIPKNAIVVEHNFLDREWSDVWKKRFSWALQFFFGGMFSALVVCYFKSSGSLGSLIMVILLATLLVGNEFLQKKYESFGLSLAFFSLLGIMFLNFTIPHLVHRIGFIWFFLSTLLSLAMSAFVWKLSRRSFKNMIAPIAISVLLIVAYLMNWVPPVPLVLKQQLACQNFDRADYSCDADAPGFLQKLGLQSPSVHRLPDHEVYVLASVYAPAALKAALEYRWYYLDPATNKYRLTDKISSGSMEINGGREKGFRSYSKKKNVPAGRYRVETAFKDGAVIGSQTFLVVDEPRDSTGYVRAHLE